MAEDIDNIVAFGKPRERKAPRGIVRVIGGEIDLMVSEAATTGVLF